MYRKVNRIFYKKVTKKRPRRALYFLFVDFAVLCLEFGDVFFDQLDHFHVGGTPIVARDKVKLIKQLS